MISLCDKTLCRYTLSSSLEQRLGRIQEYLHPFAINKYQYNVVELGQLVSPQLVGLKRHWTILAETHPFRRFRRREKAILRAKSLLLPHLHIRAPVCPLLDINQWHHSYFHWFFDCLPRVLAAADYESITGIKVMLIVPFDLQEWQKRSLESLGYDQTRWISINQADVASSILCDVLIAAPSARVQGLKGAPYDCMSPPIVNRLAHQLVANQSYSDDNLDSRYKLFISRKDAYSRRVVNQQEVMDLLGDYGFITVSLDGMTLCDQISLFRKASHVVAVHGGGLTNLIFSTGAIVVELFSERHGIRPDYFQLSLIRSLKYRYCVFPSVNSENDIVVDIAVLRKLINEQ